MEEHEKRIRRPTRNFTPTEDSVHSQRKSNRRMRTGTRNRVRNTRQTATSQANSQGIIPFLAPPFPDFENDPVPMEIPAPAPDTDPINENDPLLIDPDYDTDDENDFPVDNNGPLIIAANPLPPDPFILPQPILAENLENHINNPDLNDDEGTLEFTQPVIGSSNIARYCNIDTFDETTVERHDCGDPINACIHCGAKYWDLEKNKRYLHYFFYLFASAIQREVFAMVQR